MLSVSSVPINLTSMIPSTFATSSAGDADLRSVRNELENVTTTLLQLQAKIFLALERAEQDMAQLQEDKDTAMAELNVLRKENADLRRGEDAKVGAGTDCDESLREMAWKAIGARDDAMRKLERTERSRAKERDEDKGSSASAAYQSIPRRGGMRQPSGSQMAGLQRHVSWEQDTEADEEPAQPKEDADYDMETESISSRGYSTVEEPDEINQPPPAPFATAKNRSAMAIQRAPASQIKGRATTATRKTSPQVSTKQGKQWHCEFEKPPSAAPMSVGSWTYEELAERLGLDDETLICIEGLEWMPDCCLRVHVRGDVAFIYDPITVESPWTTYYLSWGTAVVNRNVAAYVRGEGPLEKAKAKGRVYHTFTFPAKKNVGWWYLGAMEWSPTVLDSISIWDGLSQSKKNMLTGQLKERWRDAPGQAKIGAMIDGGELQQFCVELSRTAELEEVSRAYARDTLRCYAQ